ncbi:GNAT family acetyltransferase [Pseudomonas psychrotolerans L19]|uniref:GNAT family N-acetyltransferase n=1 Tax=Pseudomonas oryzihabitans TaxID=47885 RepID=UPI00023A47E3|nr:GNAT family N-acetyltransferase [Pseudomonas psychrotolerans]EHK70809.1 GNAT family acetyltransferase [Pseudomonas psychrotolerans L19]
MSSSDLQIVQIDYMNPEHGKALAFMLDQYARDTMGGGEALSPETLAKLPSELAKRPDAFSVLALIGSKPVGLINCFEGFSTFYCKPLVNIHDVVVLDEHRGKGISHAMLAKVEEISRDRNCCKLTLEVLEGNLPAKRAYEKHGFGSYQLGETAGKAEFWQKLL